MYLIKWHVSVYFSITFQKQSVTFDLSISKICICIVFVFRKFEKVYNFFSESGPKLLACNVYLFNVIYMIKFSDNNEKSGKADYFYASLFCFLR